VRRTITAIRKNPAGTSGDRQGDHRRSPPDCLPACQADAWIGQQNAPMTRPEAMRAMMETILRNLSKDTSEKPAKKAKGK
jgi:hypothetical protein